MAATQWRRLSGGTLRIAFPKGEVLPNPYRLNDVAIGTSSDGDAIELLLTRLDNRLFLFVCYPSVDLGVSGVVDWVAELIARLLRVTGFRNLHLCRQTLLHGALANRIDPVGVNGSFAAARAHQVRMTCEPHKLRTESIVIHFFHLIG